ncbi:MAG: Brp/Blh family beta-carotene 15,15'-dioxygenase [Gracilimonas sp.]|nr:Brp/Blh family beta-carotene 15,15'-dioxygenase [Gracilimonas sp.]
MKKTHTGHTLHQVVIGAFALILNICFPEFIENIRFWILGFAILAIGMPHGALDHIITYKSFPNKDKRQKRVWFYGYYTALMVLYALLWIWFPLFSFLLFLAITLYHFGQADAERFDLDQTAKTILQYARGLTIVGLIVYGSEPRYISDVIEVITGYSSYQLVAGISNYGVVPIVLGSIYPIAYLFVISFLAKQKPNALFHLDALIVPALFIIADPIFAFAVYFGSWHSFNHAKTMIHYLNDREMDVSMKWFYKKTFLLSVMSYVGLALLYFITQAFGDEDLLVALLFVLISVLTLPHIFIVKMMYRKF